MNSETRDNKKKYSSVLHGNQIKLYIYIFHFIIFLHPNIIYDIYLKKST